MQDFATLGVVNVRYCGYIAVVKLEGKESSKMDTHFQSIELLDQPEGGANALNINSFCQTLQHVTEVSCVSYAVLMFLH